MKDAIPSAEEINERVHDFFQSRVGPVKRDIIAITPNENLDPHHDLKRHLPVLIKDVYSVLKSLSDFGVDIDLTQSSIHLDETSPFSAKHNDLLWGITFLLKSVVDASIKLYPSGEEHFTTDIFDSFLSAKPFIDLTQQITLYLQNSRFTTRDMPKDIAHHYRRMSIYYDRLRSYYSRTESYDQTTHDIYVQRSFQASMDALERFFQLLVSDHSANVDCSVSKRNTLKAYTVLVNKVNITKKHIPDMSLISQAEELLTKTKSQLAEIGIDTDNHNES